MTIGFLFCGFAKKKVASSLLHVQQVYVEADIPCGIPTGLGNLILKNLKRVNTMSCSFWSHVDRLHFSLSLGAGPDDGYEKVDISILTFHICTYPIE